jgi:hypothetical protein
MKLFLETIIISILLTSCGALKVMRMQKKGKVQDVDFYKTTKFVSKNNLIIVKVKIKGIEYNFIYDSGAPINVISTELATTLGLKAVANMNIGNSQGTKSKKSYYLIDSMSIADVAFYKQTCIASDLKSTDCIFDNIDGIIGARLMQKAYWFINNEKNEISLTNTRNNLPQLKNATTIGFKINDNSPLIDFEMAGFKHKKIEFDLGSANGLYLNTTMISERSNFLYDTYSVGNASKGLDGSGKVDTTFYIKKIGLKFGNLTIPTEQMVKVRSKHSSIIGMEILKNYNLILDWDKKEILFDKIQEANKVVINTAGFRFNKVGNQIQVNEIFANSNAQKAGLQLGDIIKSINSVNYYNLNSAEQCSLLNTPIKEEIETFHLVFERNGKEITLDFNKTIF